METGDMEFDSFLDREQAHARDWFAEMMDDGQLALFQITRACSADSPAILKTLSTSMLDCIQRLALLKLHELTHAYKEAAK